MAGIPSISVRKYIRRGDGPRHEPTSTLVLTSPGKYYVDIRAILPTDASAPPPITATEWAFAGPSISTPAEFSDGKLIKPAHTIWTHWIDTDTLEEISDEGDMVTQPDGTVLEVGTMPHPETGAPMEYEELWEDLEAKGVGEEKRRVAFVLRMNEATRGARGMIIRIGEWIQGIVRVGDVVSTVRWQWVAQEGTWKKIVETEKGVVGCELLFTVSDEAVVREGKVLTAGDESKWTCIEAFLW